MQASRRWYKLIAIIMVSLLMLLAAACGQVEKSGSGGTIADHVGLAQDGNDDTSEQDVELNEQDDNVSEQNDAGNGGEDAVNGEKDANEETSGELEEDSKPEEAEQPAIEPYSFVRASDEGLPSLRELFADDFDIGVAINNSQLTNPMDGPIVLKHFNSITAENHMKIDAMHPREDMFRWEPTDEMIAFAEEHNLQVRGHTLVWHSQVPSWIFVDENGNDVSRDVLLERMKTHIQTIVSRYKGKVQSWDVLNEIIEPNDGREDGLRNSKWLEIIGEDYIEHALRYAHEADPDAKLYINDYNTHEFRKREALLSLVTDLLDKGVPIHGVGHQMHTNIDYPSINLIDQSIKVFAELGLDNQITELDMSIYNNNSTRYDEVSEQLLKSQANRYKAIFKVLLKYKDHISSVTFWGLTDDRSWLRSFPVNRNNWPLLFDEAKRTKPAFWAIVEAAEERN